MMVDASVLLAILLEEPDGEGFALRLSNTQAPFTSPLAIYETVARLMRLRDYSASEAEDVLRSFLKQGGISVVPITDEMTPIALRAAETFGKGRHPAGLNFGDCFAYACARAHDAPLLYKGNDFARTDMA